MRIAKLLAEGVGGEIIEKPKGGVIVGIGCAKGIKASINDGVRDIGIEECFGFFQVVGLVFWVVGAVIDEISDSAEVGAVASFADEVEFGTLFGNNAGVFLR